MKRTILVGVMVLGTSICSQGFGFDLLDRMLGLKGAGCDSSCCDTVVCEPACGCETPCITPCEPACGCEVPCEPACGCEVPCAPACGCETISCGPKKGLLDRLFGGKACCDAGCDISCEPACGCEVVTCDSPCGPKGGLLAKLFGGLKKSSCCDSGCDVIGGGSACGGCAPVAPAAPAPQADPMPPAPAVDSSAFLNSKRRVIQASSRAGR